MKLDNTNGLRKQAENQAKHNFRIGVKPDPIKKPKKDKKDDTNT